jgi:uncharacterized iron-regulated membrane protein
LRKLIFWLHLSAGVAAGLVILLMAATGVLLTYEKQIVAWADRTDAALPPDSTTRRLPVDALLDAARGDDKDAVIASLTISSVPGAPALVTVDRRTLALNAYTGTVLGDASPRVRRFFRSVTEWHRYIAATGSPREITRAITGWSNLLFLLIVVGGFYLWLPRNWTMAQVRAVAWFRTGLRGKARDFNWHNTIGVWSFVPLFFIVLSALPMSFPWANTALYRMAGETPPAPAQGAQPAPARADRSRDGDRVRAEGARRDRHVAMQGVAPLTLEPLWSRAEQQVAGWRTISVRMAAANAPLAFTIDRGTGGQPHLRSTLTLDRATGSVVRWETFSAQSTGRRLRMFARFTHTGELFGVTGQTIAGIASAGAVMLVWTGLSLALRRFRAWRGRRASIARNDIAQSTAA